MANAIYDVARRALLNAQLNWPITNLVLIAWKGTPVFNAVDATITAIKARGPIDVSWSLAVNTKTVATNGTAQTDIILLPKVPIGSPVTFFVMARRDPTVQNNSMPILFLDNALGLPFTPNGLDLPVTPDWLQQRGWFRP